MSLEEVGAELREATPNGWWVGRQTFQDERKVWIKFAWGTTERPRPRKPMRV